MSTHCYFQQVSPQIIEKLQCHPSLFDIFREAYALEEYSDNYWRGIEELQKEIWNDLGEQERISREIYEKLKSYIPEIVAAGLVDQFWVGSYDFFDWLDDEGLIGYEIGKDDGYGAMSYFTPAQVKIMTQKLKEFRQLNFLEVHKILYPQSSEPKQTKKAETEFWQHFETILAYCQDAVNNSYGMLLSYG
ncbi:DUF1877 family protein [Nostoc sp. PCC 7107]|uniref:DUF1877 family protein n=1 Tax=Nostoc sp. PCC 7107 TaxID=317936 RepID=UPI00029F09CA|nr:DUF1877 family protein [Nostoc sp. PCC 7107]AFY44277.1 hypothetical protein Nos7107_3712 [Nostoc sp. PCC 7107]